MCDIGLEVYFQTFISENFHDPTCVVAGVCEGVLFCCLRVLLSSPVFLAVFIVHVVVFILLFSLQMSFLLTTLIVVSFHVSLCLRLVVGRLLRAAPFCSVGFYTAVVSKVRSADPKGSAASFQRIRGYISVMVTLKFDVLLKIIAKLL